MSRAHNFGISAYATLFWSKFLSAIFIIAIFSSAAAHGRTLVIPLPNLIEDEAAFLPSILLGEPGFSFDSSIHANDLPSNISLGAALPFTDSSNARGAGWMWAIKGGISDYNHIVDKVFYPSSYFYEVSIGRGTASDDAEFYKGLRGYLEISLRNERPKLSAQDSEIANNLGISIPNNPVFMSIKMGAASIKTNLPIIGQQQGKIAYQVRSHFLFSLRNSDYSAWKVNVAGHAQCFPKTTWSCGIDLGHFHLNKTQRTGAAEDLSDFSTLATSFRWQRTSDLSLRAKLQWSMIWNRSTFNFVKMPSLNLGMVKAF